ncbi:MAG: lipid IV(A) 3-deoxy-D-manno-octulosonic acid transferase [Gammaproteobacteria bacterium]|nr:lipid IV(A) 3-deoxy-D-manno-octulosonic acid transferase [Gammaproteobacteria bacterium]
MARLLYSLVFTLLMPVIVVRLFMRARKAPAYAQNWWQRFGVLRSPKAVMGQQGGIWFHTVSVGEFLAAAPLIQQTLDANPETLITITTTTPTGSEQVKKRFAHELNKRVFHVFLPYDLPWFLNGFLRKVRPELLVILETELWPNLIHCAKKAECKVMVVNARLSEKSAKGYAKVAKLTRSMLMGLDHLAVQNHNDAARFMELGMPESRMSVTGSIKFDLDIDTQLMEQGQQLKQAWGRERCVLIMASTHAGEDEIGLAAFKAVLQDDPNALFVVVPRHPERFDAVAKLIVQNDLSLSRRSLGQSADQSQVLLVDTMGELMQFLAASDVCIMGGSFIESGGHNPLEPAALSVPVLMGPSQFNFAVICEQLEAAGALQTVTQTQLGEVALQWLKDDALRQEKGLQGKAVVDSNRGAKQKVFELIQSEFAKS